MSTDYPTPTVSKGRYWTGVVLGYLPALLLLMVGVMNIVQPANVLEGSKEIGFPAERLAPLGLVTALGALLYLIPKTSALGAIILTGFLGGAVYVHVHKGDPLTMILVPVVFATLLWVGLLLREPRLASLLPWRNH